MAPIRQPSADHLRGTEQHKGAPNALATMRSQGSPLAGAPCESALRDPQQPTAVDESQCSSILKLRQVCYKNGPPKFVTRESGVEMSMDDASGTSKCKFNFWTELLSCVRTEASSDHHIRGTTTVSPLGNAAAS
eukprot:6475946-Amphidinium_carterae.1